MRRISRSCRSSTSSLTVPNDGRPDFAVNPFNGPAPSYEQVLATACDINGNRPGCLRRSVANEIPFGDHDTSFSHMASIGVQRQFGAAMSIESNYVWTGGRKEEFAPNINLAYNPATGANLRFQDTALTPFPDWGIVRAEIMAKRSNYYGWENTLTKRFANRWQANATYTLAYFKDEEPNPFTVELQRGAPIPTVLHELGFPVAEDIGGLYGLASSDQRHRATFNGIWDMGMGFQLSGLYFFGSGERFATSWGGDLRNMGTNSTGRLRADGTAHAAQRVRRQRDPSRRHAADQAAAHCRPDDDRWHDRGIQPVQPQELRVVHDDGEQRGSIRPAVVQRERRVSAAHRAGRIQVCVLEEARE